MQNVDLTEKSGTLQNKNLLSHIKMVKETVTFGGIELKKKKKKIVAIKFIFLVTCMMIIKLSYCI